MYDFTFCLQKLDYFFMILQQMWTDVNTSFTYTTRRSLINPPPYIVCYQVRLPREMYW